MKLKLSLPAAVLAMLICCAAACSKENEQKVATPVTGGTGCDTVNMKYAADVVPILQQHCYSCHATGSNGGSGGISLDSYSDLRKWADNGFLLGNVRHDPGFVGMPYMQAKLDSCTINKIVSWVKNGSQNN